MAHDHITEGTRETVELFWRAMDRGQPDTLRAFADQYFADDLEWSAVGTGVPGAGATRGRDAVLTLLGGVRGLFEPGHPHGEVVHMLVDGCWAAAEAQVTGLMRDGRLYENRYAFFFQVIDRRIHVVREYFDTYYVNKLLGDRL
jgi:ketosteroid isomerase-like protein